MLMEARSPPPSTVGPPVSGTQPSTLSPQGPPPSTPNLHPPASSPQPSTLNPKLGPSGPQPSTLSPQPSALNPQPSAETRNPKPSALHPKPSALSPQPSALNPTPGPSRLPVEPVVPQVFDRLLHLPIVHMQHHVQAQDSLRPRQMLQLQHHHQQRPALQRQAAHVLHLRGDLGQGQWGRGGRERADDLYDMM